MMRASTLYGLSRVGLISMVAGNMCFVMLTCSDVGAIQAVGVCFAVAAWLAVVVVVIRRVGRMRLAE
jgi:hypothetical protein